MDRKKLNENLLIGLEKFGDANRLLSWNITKHDQVSPVQLRFLEYISRNTAAFNTVSQLALEFDLEKATVSDSIKNLHEKGFINKIQDENDKRSFFLVLSEKGQEELQVIGEKNRVITDLIQEFSPNQVETVNIFLMQLMKKMHQQGFIKYTRMCMTCKNFKKQNNKNDEHFCSYLNESLGTQDLKYNCSAYVM